LAAENRLLNAQGLPEFIATAPSMTTVLETITRIAPSEANVLVTGEHGTGKEVVPGRSTRCHYGALVP